MSDSSDLARDEQHGGLRMKGDVNTTLLLADWQREHLGPLVKPGDDAAG
ncbi:MAG: hypothetical protein NTV94_07840 [Planctomycetota bacterium]|nr:hypothetical protein [Planctomycetota bacterium]